MGKPRTRKWTIARWAIFRPINVLPSPKKLKRERQIIPVKAGLWVMEMMIGIVAMALTVRRPTSPPRMVRLRAKCLRAPSQVRAMPPMRSGEQQRWRRAERRWRANMAG